MSAPPAAAAAAVLVKSADLSGEPTVSGYDFNNGVDHDALLASMISTGARRARRALRGVAPAASIALAPPPRARAPAVASLTAGRRAPLPQASRRQTSAARWRRLTACASGG